MKNKYYLIASFLFLVLCIFSCKEKSDKPSVIDKTTAKIVKKSVDTIRHKKQQGHIKDFQGIWESFSEYLEHESEFKDYNQNKYYKIISEKQSIDITLVNGEHSDNEIDIKHIGFIDSFDSKLLINEETLFKNLKESGKLLIRFKKAQKKYEKSDIETSSNFSRYFDVTETLIDGFNYLEKDKEISFRKISSLPEEVFIILKTTNKKTGIDYMKDFKIQEQSKKIKVITNKTFFHTEMSEASKRKAFLVQGDIAYLEEIHDDWVKVYYDGKIVSGGYIKKSDVEVF